MTIEWPAPPRSVLFRALAIAIVVFAVVRVAATHRVFSQTTDEPAHIASGYEWWSGRTYHVDPSHPPLARIFEALPLYVRRIPMDNHGEPYQRGNSLLYADGQYVRHLAAARRGNLIFLIIGIGGVIAWGRRCFSNGTALLAGLLYSSLPPILAHAGLATTDMAITAMFGVFLLAFDAWLERPDSRRGALFGAAIGLALLTKFTFLLFGSVAIVTIVATRPREALRSLNRSLVIVFVVAFFIVWGAYKFEVKTFVAADKTDYIPTTIAPAFLRPAARWMAAHVPLPAPEFFIGLGWVALHNREGHVAFLLGRYSTHGFWDYFPVLLYYKTPIFFLLLSALGVSLLVHRRQFLGLALLPLVMLIAVMPSSLNIGVRHILPIYAPLSIIAAHAAATLWRESSHWFARATVVTLVAGTLFSSIRAHPDYLSWFNISAGEHPERIAVDSNLDWGQDVLRLIRVIHSRGIDHLAMLYYGSTDLARLALPAEGLQPYVVTRGWVVVSETALALHPDTPRGGFDWLHSYAPVQRVGTLRLYYIPSQ